MTRRRHRVVRLFTARSDDTHNSSVASIDAPDIHDFRIMVTHGTWIQSWEPITKRGQGQDLVVP